MSTRLSEGGLAGSTPSIDEGEDRSIGSITERAEAADEGGLGQLDRQPAPLAGEARQVDLTSYFSSPLKDPKPHTISITKTVGMDAQASVNGMSA